MTDRYTFLQRLVHWATAIVVIPALIVGALLGILGFEGTLNTFGQAGTNAIYEYHKTFGVLALILIAARLALRARNGQPPAEPSLSRVERLASGAVHAGLYAGLVAMPLLGWAATATGGFPVEFFSWDLPPILGKNEALSRTLYEAHGAVGLALAILAAIHIAAALRHWRVKRDGVMRRMSLI